MAVTGEKIAWSLTTPIKSFEDFIKRISSLEEYHQDNLLLFRGQPCDKPLLPKLGRDDIAKSISNNFKDFESKIFSDFSKRYLAFHTKVYTNDWDLLALGQHYGLPTRLLDWTESALIALWFATEKKLENHDTGVVWYLIPDEADIIDPKKKESGIEQNPFTRKATKIFCPDYISERIIAQKGWFSCHTLRSDNRFIEFETMAKYKYKLGKWIIDCKLFPEIRRKLNTMGINGNAVYPDLQGLTNYLKWKHLKLDNNYPDYY